MKNCSNPELVSHRSYFVRHPMELRVELRATCNWTVDWYTNASDAANKERSIILKNVRQFCFAKYIFVNELKRVK